MWCKNKKKKKKKRKKRDKRMTTITITRIDKTRQEQKGNIIICRKRNLVSFSNKQCGLSSI